jgi:hypothetical protein
VTFTFNDGNTNADVTRRDAIDCGKFQIQVVASVTNTVNGGGGHDKVIRMTLTSEGRYEAEPQQWVVRKPTSAQQEVILDNRAPVTASNPPGSGAGYEVLAQLKVPTTVCESFQRTGNLVVTYKYDKDVRSSSCCPGKLDHHVAFNDPNKWNDPKGRSHRSLVMTYMTY